MKLTEQKLREIIKEELTSLNEAKAKIYSTEDLRDIDWKEGRDVWVPNWKGKGAVGNMFSMTMWVNYDNTHDVDVNKRGVWNWIEEFENEFGKTEWSVTDKKGYELIPVGNKKLDKHMVDVVAKMKSPNNDTLGLTSPYGNKLDRWS